jgi:hypothetical protein
MSSTQPSHDLPYYSLRRLLVVTAIVAVFVAGISSLARKQSRRRAEEFRVAKADAETRINLVKKIDALSAELGRVPEDERELVQLLGGPMPQVDVAGRAVAIQYRRTGPNSFTLYHWEWEDADYYLYDSTASKAGWQAICD